MPLLGLLPLSLLLSECGWRMLLSTTANEAQVCNLPAQRTTADVPDSRPSLPHALPDMLCQQHS
jgi:hypothetical protein